MAIATEVKTQNNTHLTAKREQVDQGVTRLLDWLHRHYLSVGKGSPSSAVMRPYFREMGNKLRGANIGKQAVFSVWRRIPNPSNDSNLREMLQTIGWLLAHSGEFDGSTQVIANELSLDHRHNPWPEQPPTGITSTPIRPQPAAPQDIRPEPHQPDSPPKQSFTHPDLDAFYALKGGEPSLDAYQNFLGSITGQHFLIVEDMVDGAPALLQLLLGANDSDPDANGVIIDLVGDRYLGLELRKEVVFSAGDETLDIPGRTLTDEERWFLPQMEAVWRAAHVLGERMRIRKTNARSGQPLERFSPFFLVLRNWNRILKEWRGLNATTIEKLLAVWRIAYGHKEGDVVNIAKDVDRILDLGYSCNSIIIMTVRGLPPVDEIGMSLNALNSMLMIILGDATVERGGRALQSALSDGRLGFLTKDNKADIKTWIGGGMQYSLRTGHQIALASLDPPEVYVVPTWKRGSKTGSKIYISQYKTEKLQGFSHEPLLQPG